MDVYNGATGKWEIASIEARELVLMSSLLCSSDVIAAVSLVSYEAEPRLFSIVFGEGITNDAVSIILFNTVLQYTQKTSKFTWSSPFEIVGGFCLLGGISLLIGLFFGLASALFMKYFRSLTHNAINQAVILFCFAYMSYVTSELCHESGIISLLVCGITQAHYTYYNLSSLGQHASYVIFQFISFFMEAFVFIYLGISFFMFSHLSWCPKLIAVEVLVIMVGRFIAVVGFLNLLKLCRYDCKLTFKQQIFIWFAGMIRGAIAFGLVLKIDEKTSPNRGIIITTTLTLVIFTTVVMGSLLGVLQNCLFGKEAGGEAEEKKLGGIDQPLMSGSDVHPNEAPALEHPNQSAAEQEKNEAGCGSRFGDFEKKYIKPIFVHNYSVEMQQQVDLYDSTVIRSRQAKDVIME